MPSFLKSLSPAKQRAQLSLVGVSLAVLTAFLPEASPAAVVLAMVLKSPFFTHLGEASSEESK
jgi:hypothetical protein